MRFARKITLLSFAASILLVSSLSSCKGDLDNPTPGPDNPDERPVDPPTAPATSIPDELVGTWYASHNANPLTENWEKKTFQGEVGFREFRTMVFTKDGKNAVEYTSEVYNYNGEISQYMYKITGTLEYKSNPASLTFHAQTGIKRTFTRPGGYSEAPIIQKDLNKYVSILLDPSATTLSSSANYLKAKRVDGDNYFSVDYRKVSANAPTNTNLPSTTPPATGTYVKIGNLYYPTVTIGSQEWMSANYAGPGSLQESTKPQFGTFLEYAELKNLPVPAGWRIPSKQDYTKLLESQGLVVNEWGSTDGEDVQSKRLLGQLMSATGWTKQDGYANNRSGFNALPGDVRRPRGTNYGEGTNCVLWTSEKNAQDSPMSFNIVQLPSDTYASFSPIPIGYTPTLVPVRFMRDK